MTPNSAVGIYSTQAWARVLAFVVNARLVLRTVRVDVALGAAVGRGAGHARQAGALAFTINLARRI